jgi:hypothetical protein
MKHLTGLFFLFLYASGLATAQDQQFIYDNKVYLPQIKTVQCFNTQKEQSLPVIALGTGEQLLFSFDDLTGGSQEYWYTIEHCTSDWKSSRLSTIDYLESFRDDRIINYKYSFNTLQKFTNYQIMLPNEQIRPKIAGNYLLKVYLQGNLQKPVISQRFYVVNNLINVGAEVAPSAQVANRFKNQKINFTVFHKMPIQNPQTDLKAVVMQNNNPETAILNTKPTFIRQGSLVYNDLNTNDFPAGNEFRKFDIRSLRYKAEHVQEIFRDSVNNVVLFEDLSGNANKYTNVIDENGNFFIRNQEGRDDNTDSDYANVLFTLQSAPPTIEGEAYVVGRFNNYVLSKDNQLNYEPSRKRFSTNLKLKQGLYDYKYVWLDKKTGKVDQTIFEGSFFETENTYQVFVYYRKPGMRWEELIGYTSLNSERR